MDLEQLKTSEEWNAIWEQESGCRILDPDGWDRRNFDASWAELITREEFDNRRMMSTCKYRQKEPHAN